MRLFYAISIVLVITVYFSLSKASIQCVDSFEDSGRCCKIIQTGNDTENYFCWPRLLVVGTMKSGTTLASLYMTSHPQMNHAKPKELHFFGNKKSNAETNDDYLQTWGPSVPGERSINVESTPLYFYHTESIAAIKAAAPSTRLVIFLRNPTERSWSEYRMVKDIEAGERPSREWFEANTLGLTACFRRAIASGVRYATDKCFDQFPYEQLNWNHLLHVREEMRTRPKRHIKCLMKSKSFTLCGLNRVQNIPDYSSRRDWTWHDRGHYVQYLKPWFKVFSKEQILILFYDDLIRKSVQTMQRVFKHASIDPIEITPMNKEETKEAIKRVFPTFGRNSGWRTGKKPKMPAAARAETDALYRESNRQLRSLIGELPKSWSL